ncbi:MAG TPA: GGDEF domain-containing protein [Rudaea sp.]|nr:GGDEF domain-containing protein [Rudaea sp.]
MLRAAWLLLAFASAAFAGEADVVRLRHLSDAEPTEALAEGRKLLDSGRLSDDTAQAREVLRWMGRAAIVLSDDAAIAEVVLRLDGLAQTHADTVAKAYAGFLRAQRLQAQNRARDGLAQALASADLLQETKDPQLLAVSDYSLCDAYYEVEEFARALPFCQHARARWHEAGNPYEEARAINLEAIVRFNQNDNDTATGLLKDARSRFAALGEDSMVVSIDDNLARLYIEQKRPAEALELARRAYAIDRATGRIQYAILSRANIARALSALKRHAEAKSEIAADVAETRERKLTSNLPDLLDTQSRIAEAAGDLPLALKALRESSDLDQNAPKQAGSVSIAELETRFAAREKELQIRELEHANRAKQVELASANAQSLRHEDELARQRLILIGAIFGLVALAIIITLLLLLLRAQRRHGAELSVQALRDPLTGVDNRRALFTCLRDLLAQPAPAQPHALLLVDLDHFKRVNDSRGHPAGDAVLVAVAARLARALGARGRLARLGGEEFAIVLASAGHDAALDLAEELRDAVAEVAVPGIVEPGQVTASIGVALYDGQGLDDWMRAVDRALYAAKARGRNCVVEATSVRVGVA